MAEFKIHSDFEPRGDQPQAVDSLVTNLEQELPHQTLLGVTGSGKTFTMAKTIERINRPTLIISHNKTLAAQLFGEFKQLFPENAVEYFISYYDYYQPEAYLPVSDTFIEKDSSVNDEIDRLRLKATSSLLHRRDVIVISSVSCIYGIGSPADYKKQVICVEKGKNLRRRDFLKRMINIHYLRNDMVLERGNFRVRGDVIEIFPAYDEHCVRIELFGTTIDSISRFDPISGEILADMEQIYIYPAKHFVTEPEMIRKIIPDISSDLNQRLEELRGVNKLVEAQRLEQRTNFDMEMLREVGYCSGIENYSRYLAGRKPGDRPWTLIDFFPDDFLLILDESHVTIPQIQAMYNGDRSRKEVLVEFGFRLPSALDNRPLKYEEFKTLQNQTIYASATPAERELDLSQGLVVEQVIRPTGLLDPLVEQRPTEGQIDDLIGEIRACTARQERVLITTLTKKMSENLSEYLRGINLRVRYLHSEIDTLERVKILRDLRLGEFDVLVGINLLREGLDLPEVSLVAVLDADKQGFLRSKSSLMQVAGRAARHVNGRVLLYGDRITEAMQYLIDVSTRRREMQEQFNQEHGITPKTVYKSTDEIMYSTAVADSATGERTKPEKMLSKFEVDPQDKAMVIDIMRREMQTAAEKLEFERAATLRDEIQRLETEIKVEA